MLFATNTASLAPKKQTRRHLRWHNILILSFSRGTVAFWHARARSLSPTFLSTCSISFFEKQLMSPARSAKSRTLKNGVP